MLADRAEALDRDTRALEVEPAGRRGHLCRVTKPPAGGPDLVEWNAPEGGWQPHCAADFVVDPRHASFVGAHVRAEYVVVLGPERVGKGPDEPLFLVAGQSWIRVQHGFATAVREASHGVLQRHRAGEAEALRRAHVGRHPQAPDRRAACDIVDHERGLETESRLMYVDDLRRTEIVGDAEDLFHSCTFLSPLRRREWPSRRPRAYRARTLSTGQEAVMRTRAATLPSTSR